MTELERANARADAWREVAKCLNRQLQWEREEAQAEWLSDEATWREYCYLERERKNARFFYVRYLYHTIKDWITGRKSTW